MKTLLYILTLIFLTTELVAQQPFARHLTSKDGLPSNEVYNIHQDKKGYIWIASEDGLCRYDGKYFQRYHNAFMSSKAGSFIKEDKKGRIWYGNFDGVIFYVENDSLKNFKSPHLMSIPGDFSVIGDTLILIEPNQNLKGFDIHTHKEIYSKKLNYLYNIVYQSENQFQIIHDKGIDFYNSNFKPNYSISNEGTNQYLKALEYNEGYFTYWADNGKLNVFYIKDGIRKELYSSKNDAFVQGFYLIDQKLWLLKKDGILLIDIETNKTETLFVNESISHVCKDMNGYVWISTNFNGIYIINPNLQAKDYPTSSFNFKFLRTDNSILSYDDIGRIYDITANAVTPIYSLPLKNQIYKIIEIQHPANNKLLNRVKNYTFFNYKGKQFIAISSGVKDIELIDEKYAAMSISGMFGLINYHVTDFKSLWDSIYKANEIYDENISSQPGTSSLNKDLRAKSVAYDKVNNQLYFATNIGLFNTTPSKSEEVMYEQNKIFASTLVSFYDHIFCLLNNGELLYIYNHQLSKIDIGSGKSMIRKIKRIRNSLVLIGESEIFSFDVYADFKVSEVKLKSIHINQSIAELNDIELVDNKYYLSYPNQLFIVDTNLTSQHVSFPFYITEVVTNKRKIRNTSQLNFASNENDITIHFAILNYYKTSLAFQYRINDENWKTLESLDRSINLASLSSGNYRIQFKLNNVLMNEDVRFVIKKNWYLQSWFIGLCLLLLLTFGYLFYKRRIQLSHKENIVLLEKTKLEKDLRQSLLSSIKSQMNPHFLFNALNTIQSYIITEDKENASNYLSKFSKLTRRILDMSDKETISLQEEIDALILYIELEKMRFADLNFTIEFEKDIIAANLLIPSMIVQPYVENAIKHGLLHKIGDKQLFIKIKIVSQYLMIQIEDNGVGRVQSEIINKNKSDNHRSFASNANLKRIELLNAEKNEIGVEYTDKLNEKGESAGTIVNIKLPIKKDNMIRAIIIDDELQGRKLLQALIKSHAPEISVLDECADLPNGVKAIRKHKPDLIFLDIEMPGHSGLELLDFFDEKEINFGIIFTTAYNEYAIKAFKMSAVDYLLKPISGEDLEQAMDRFHKRFFKSETVKAKAEPQIVGIEKTENKIAIPVGQSIKFIDLDDIVYLKAENTYTEIHLQDTSKMLVSRTLKNFEDVLEDKSNFYRCHKSYIINRQYILDYVKSDGGYLILKPRIEIPISPEKVQGFLDGAMIVRR